MAKGMTSWCSDTPVPDVTQLTRDDLLNTWVANRANTLGRMAAEELMKREYAERKLKETT
jgi:hypothetical protein